MASLSKADTQRAELVTGLNEIAHPIGMPVQAFGGTLITPDESTNSTTYEGYDFNSSSLKDIITNPENKTKIRPVLISFSSLPKSGKTQAVKHILKYYVDECPLTPMTRKSERLEAEGISYYELLAAGFKPLRNLSITEVTQESCCTSGILSAFKRDLLKDGKVPLFDVNAQLTQGFENRNLDDHLHYTYRYLCQHNLPKGPTLDDKERKYAENLKKLLPEGIALINIWDFNINKTVLHFLAALQGHLYNNHTWLFLDLERDFENLDKPPEITEGGLGNRDGAVLMKWQPRLHYLLQSCRMSENSEKQRKRVCTMFAKHKGTYTNGALKQKIDELEERVQATAKQIYVATLLEEKIKTINLENPDDAETDSLRLYQKFQQVIYETPFEEVPIAWVFLRSLFYRSDKRYISRGELASLAKQCGISEKSLEDFCKFYTSFGSIFDLSLVNPEYKYVIVKPIGFLRSLDKFLYPSQEIHQRYPSVSCGIVPEKACREVLGTDWPVYMDALVCLNLATKVTCGFLEMSPDCPLLDRNDMHYYIPLSRTGSLITNADPNSVHLITSADTPHIFKQVTFARHLLSSLPQPKLVPCKSINQTIIKDTANSTTVTMVSNGPVIKLHLDQPSEAVCSSIVQAYDEVAKSSDASVKYMFVKLCALSGDIPNTLAIPSTHFHILPSDASCQECQRAGRADEILRVWNEVLIHKKNATQQPQPIGGLRVSELAVIAEKIASFDIDIIAQTFDVPYKSLPQFEGFSGEKLIIEILLFWERSQESQNCRQAFAQKLSELKVKLLSNESLSEGVRKKITKEFEKMMKKLCYVPDTCSTINL